MRLRITKIGTDVTVTYALDELSKYLCRMDHSLRVEEFQCATYEEYCEEETDSILLGVGLGVEENPLDDKIRIAIKNGKGVITGANPRSVLFAVYRFLYELGCRFPSPEECSEVIPEKVFTKADLTVDCTDAPAYRHRGIDLGGAIDYQMSVRCINWMAKLGLNSVFIEYLYPVQGFARTYNYDGEKISRLESQRLQKRLEEEIKKRGMLYHTAGHNWQNDPFGIPGDTYTKLQNFSIPEETKKYVALVNGKRELFNNNPLQTNMCYSNPEVRKIMTEAVVSYCAKNPGMDYVHVWLSDSTNGMCECERCRDQIPADLYVKLLNEIDERLTAEGIPTKIAFLSYCDLSWAPIKEQFKNKDRFIFMATIAHSYSKPLTCFEREPRIEPFRLNQNQVPKTNIDSIAMIQDWQKVFDGDSFLFDYNQIWDHYKDPGYMHCAERIAGDSIALKELGFNGLHSCQFINVGFPSWLPTYTHGLTVWNPGRSFDEIADEYFTAIYREKGAYARAWLQELSDRFDPPYLRHEKPRRSDEHVRRYRELAEDIRNKIPELKELAKTDGQWSRLVLHASFSARLADALSLYAAENPAVRAEMAKFREEVYAHYRETYDYLDTNFYTLILGRVTDSSDFEFAREVETEA